MEQNRQNYRTFVFPHPCYFHPPIIKKKVWGKPYCFVSFTTPFKMLSASHWYRTLLDLTSTHAFYGGSFSFSSHIYLKRAWACQSFQFVFISPLSGEISFLTFPFLAFPLQIKILLLISVFSYVLLGNCHYFNYLIKLNIYVLLLCLLCRFSLY